MNSELSGLALRRGRGRFFLAGLAAALPELPYACGLNTVALLVDDLAVEPLIAVDGVIKVGDLAVDEGALNSHRPNEEVQRFWQARLVQTRELASG